MAHLPSSLKVNPRFTPSSKDSNSKASVSRAVIQKAHLNVGDVLRVHTGSTLNHSEEWNYGQELLVTQTKKSALISKLFGKPPLNQSTLVPLAIRTPRISILISF